MSRLYFLFFIFSLSLTHSQNKRNIRYSPLVKDSFFLRSVPQSRKNKIEKIELLYSDVYGVEKDKYNGNPFFRGNATFSHKGSLLTADVVVLYSKENFVKAYGGVMLKNSDGSVITSQEMEYDGNTERGIARKNVRLRDNQQTIETEALYYDRWASRAYFDSGGIIWAEDKKMTTRSAVYHLAEKIIDFSGDVRIESPDYSLKGTNLRQNQNTNVAFFWGPTTIVNKKNPTNTLYTEEGTFDDNAQEAYLNFNSIIRYRNKTLRGDRMYYNQLTGYGTAKGNVRLEDPEEKRYVMGGYGEIFEKKDSTVITEKPYAVKIFAKDSVYFSAQKFIAFQRIDSTDKEKKKTFLRAYKKARLYKSDMQARADSLSFNETDGTVQLEGKPILWNYDRQVSGDSVRIFLNAEKERIDSLYVLGHAFAISKSDSLNLKDEFDQVKGKQMRVYYRDNQIRAAKVIGNAEAIIYADEKRGKRQNKERIGVNISSCGIIEAEFVERKVEVISCNIGAKSTLYPMSKISKNQRFFSDFNWNTKDRPKKWRDIFLDSPNYEEKVYESDNLLYEKAQEKLERERKKRESQLPKRAKRRE
ncbi:MAG: organic solvent tolerance protein OstA [Bergeyella sp.]|nr:organic solvent tolerance protein OstA [Bergeyella sp.]